jgi:hypothetical protein
MVVLTNYATPDMRRKFIELGATQVFDKSTEIDALIDYCSRLAAGHPLAPGPHRPLRERFVSARSGNVI